MIAATPFRFCGCKGSHFLPNRQTFERFFAKKLFLRGVRRYLKRYWANS